jgi:hypothetical protein
LTLTIRFIITVFIDLMMYVSCWSIKQEEKGECQMHRFSLLALVAIAATTFGQTERASAPGAASATKAEAPKGPPLPLHTIEGVGGVVS